MKKEQATTAVSVKGQFSQNDVPDMLKAVEAKLKEIKGDEEEAKVRIDVRLGNFGIIKDVKDPLTLIHAYNYITGKARGFNDVKTVFQPITPSVPVPDFKEGGYTLEQWQTEIKLQYRSATYEVEIKKLETVAQKLKGLLSEEHRVAVELAEIADLIQIPGTATDNFF